MTTISAQWNLTDLYPNNQAFETAYQQVQEQIGQLKAYRGHLAEAGSVLYECLRLQDDLEISLGQLLAYAKLQRDLNASDSSAQALTGRVYHLLTQAGEAGSFIEPELLALPEQNLTELMRSQTDFTDYDFYFQELMRRKPHILSDKEEKLLAQMSQVVQAPKDIFTMLARADFVFPDIQDENGQVLPVSEGLYSSYLTRQDATLREQAFNSLLETYHHYRNTLAATYNGSVKKDGFLAKARGFSSSQNAALFDDHVSPKVYENLLQTVEKKLPLLHDYVALKKAILQLPEIHFYDLYTPLIQQVDLKISYEQAPDFIKQALKPLGEDYLKQIETAFAQNWIDAFERPNKQTGAYSWGIYGIHPFILLNYHDRYQDLSTLAHELGHAMHSAFSQSAQPFRKSQYTIFTAEVASITNEMLLLQHMLKSCEDPKTQAYLLNQALEGAKGTLFRQTQFAEFEIKIHQLSETGQALTANELEKIWLDLNRKYYGPDLVLDDNLSAEWSRIPHFYNNFYVYKYATGYAAASALSSAILKEGSAATDRYLSFLKSGGSNYPLELLRQAGVDMTTPAPITEALNQFEQQLQQLKVLLQ